MFDDCLDELVNENVCMILFNFNMFSVYAPTLLVQYYLQPQDANAILLHSNLICTGKKPEKIPIIINRSFFMQMTFFIELFSIVVCADCCSALIEIKLRKAEPLF